MMMRLMAFTVASAASVAMASAVPSSPAAAPLAAASRLYTCGQGMGAVGTSVARPRVLDPSHGFPQFIGVSVCYQQKHLFLDIKIRGKVIQNAAVCFFFSGAHIVLFSFYH